MEDLLVAKKQMEEDGLALVIVKGGDVIFSSKESGIRSLLLAIDKLGDELRESAVADKVVGRAAAMLWTYANVDSLYAELISESALEFLNDTGLVIDYEEITPKILNKAKDDMCPFEKIAAECIRPKECYNRVTEFLSAKKQGAKVKKC